MKVRKQHTSTAGQRPNKGKLQQAIGGEGFKSQLDSVTQYSSYLSLKNDVRILNEYRQQQKTDMHDCLPYVWNAVTLYDKPQ